MTSVAHASARTLIRRPAPDEYPEWASIYITDATNALERSGADNIRDVITRQPLQFETLLASVTEDEAERGYEAGKWTIKESLVHVLDVERVFAYRMLRFARADRTPLPGFEHNDWVPESRANARSMRDIMDEMKALRAATIATIDSFDEAALSHMGTANGKEFSTRTLVWMIAGHTVHHLNLFRERYLPALGK